MFTSTKEIYILWIKHNIVYCLKIRGNYISQPFEQYLTLQFVFKTFVLFSLQTEIISLNNIKHLIVVMVKYGVLFEVLPGFLNIIQRSFFLKGLTVTILLILILYYPLAQ
jgi:hypothetical protein